MGVVWDCYTDSAAFKVKVVLSERMNSDSKDSNLNVQIVCVGSDLTILYALE